MLRVNFGSSGEGGESGQVTGVASFRWRIFFEGRYLRMRGRLDKRAGSFVQHVGFIDQKQL